MFFADAAATRWGPETVIDAENVSLLMFIVYISLMVYYWNTIDAKLTKFIPSVNVSIILIRRAIGETHV